MSGLCDGVRASCARIAREARWVRIDLDRIGAVEPALPPELDPERHYLEGSRADVATYLLCLDTINFGSGWFPTLRKRPGASGYFTVAWALADRFRSHGAWTRDELAALDGPAVAGCRASRPITSSWRSTPGRSTTSPPSWGTAARSTWSTPRTARRSASPRRSPTCPSSATRASTSAPQITPSDLALAGVAEWDDLGSLTIFADNLVPHVLRVDRVLRYEPELARTIDSGELLPPGEQEREIRACAVHACELIAAELGVDARTLDHWLWQRGGAPEYKARPRHRTRTVFY